MNTLSNQAWKSPRSVAEWDRAEFAIVMVPLAFFSALLILLLLSYGVLSSSLAAYGLVAATGLLTAIALTEASLLAGLGVVALAGMAQAAATIWFPVPLTLYLDELPFLLTIMYTVIVAVKWRLGNELRIFGVVLLLVGIALFRAGITTAAIYQAREILVPFLIGFIAFVALQLPTRDPRYARSIEIFTQLAIALALVTIIYMVFEYVGGPPLNPLEANDLKDANNLNTVYSHAVIVDGHLSNYLFYPGGASSTSTAIVRLGGLVMNPPVAGIFMGSSTVIAFWQYWNRRHISILVLCIASALVTWGTYSRGGILIALVGIGLPFLVRYTNRTVAGGIVVIAAIYLGAKISQQGSSSLHYEGLIAGLTRAIHNPLGQGLATIGDVSSQAAGTQGEGESLAAIPFAAIGLPAVALYAAALWGSFRGASVQNWPAALGLGILLCALFTESASSLAGTVIVWGFCGIGLALAAKREPLSAKAKTKPTTTEISALSP